MTNVSFTLTLTGWLLGILKRVVNLTKVIFIGVKCTTFKSQGTASFTVHDIQHFIFCSELGKMKLNELGKQKSAGGAIQVVMEFFYSCHYICELMPK